MHFTLEKHKFFPYIAWTLVIGFVVFTYSLTIQLLETSENIEARTVETTSALDQDA